MPAGRSRCVLPWETPPDPRCPPRASPASATTGYWGTKYGPGNAMGGGSLRGFFDYNTGQVAAINSVTDGTSNTILVGEVLPIASRPTTTSGNSTAAPRGHDRPDQLQHQLRPGLGPQLQRPTGRRPARRWGAATRAAAKGFKSKHPGGANFCFADGSVKFLKSNINMATYCALGSRAGGEVISADAY